MTRIVDPRSCARRAGRATRGHALALATLLAAAGVCASAAAGEARARPDAPAPASAALREFFDATWERELADDPSRATYLGDARYNDRWTDMSLDALERRHRRDVETLEALQRIPREALAESDRLSYELFEREYRERIRRWRFKPHLWLIDHQGGIQTLAQTAELLPFQTSRDYEDWIKRLEAVGTLVDQHVVLLETAARERRTQPRVIMERIVPQLATLAGATAQQSAFYAPFKRMPESIPAAQREALERRGREAIERVVLPAYGRLQSAFTQRYLPATRQSVGLSATPDGAAFYEERIAHHTTTSDLTAERIHAIGLAEVARIRAGMERIREQVGFAGTLAQFFVFLRTDPQFFHRSSEELFAAYQIVSKRIDPNLVRLFGRLPRTPYGVRAIPAATAPDTTTAYYQPPALDGTRPGYYYVNLYRPEARPKWEIEVLSAHEAVPGHHLQIALAYEQAGLPQFRRQADYTAYVEGWALYSERLGTELGLYQDPYSKFGELTYDMWRAVRLVVDTGLHAKGWTRQQAIDYFRDNAPRSEVDIVNEIDRYIAWPGQALAYKIGQLRILDLRALAERELGERFDLRAFHDALLATGAVPLDVMERTMRAWIERQRALPAQAPAAASAAARTR